MKSMTDLTKALSQKRHDLGLTQMEVAEKLGYSSPQFISNWERGLANPPMHALKQLVKIYKMDSAEVFKLLLASHEQSLREEFYGKKRKDA